ncbi:MAG: TlpA family protein disulfide reductase [Myxococcota bacterium]|nr:TlpA family protein disulfide reductase [Myxococcota bacterium]
MTRTIPSVVGAAATLILGCGASGPAAAPSVGGYAGSSATIAPDFTGRDADGNTFRLSDHLRKEVVLLDFWATYCEPCKAEFSHLRAMYDRERANGLLVVGVAMDGPETVADVPAFVKRFEIDFPIVVDDDSRIASLYNPKKSMPLSVIIDRAGRIAVVREGYNPGDERLVAADVSVALGHHRAEQ